MDYHKNLSIAAIGAVVFLGGVQTASAHGHNPLYLSEIKLGALAHAYGPISDGKESGTDINAEVLFQQPSWGWWDTILAPRPTIGTSVNLNGFTDQLYGVLTWDWRPVRHFFTDFSFGLSLNDGERLKKPGSKDRALGSHILFRSGLELGYQITCNHNISLAYSHISHAKLLNDENAGLDTLGVRFGYRF